MTSGPAPPHPDIIGVVTSLLGMTDGRKWSINRSESDRARAAAYANCAICGKLGICRKQSTGLNAGRTEIQSFLKEEPCQIINSPSGTLS